MAGGDHLVFGIILIIIGFLIFTKTFNPIGALLLFFGAYLAFGEEIMGKRKKK